MSSSQRGEQLATENCVQLDLLPITLNTQRPKHAEFERHALEYRHMTTLEALQLRLRGFVAERDWEQFHTPKNLAMALAGEVGELVAEFQWLTPEQAWAKDDPELAARIRAEMGDVMIYLTQLAGVLGIDLVEAANDKLTDSERRYPADVNQGRVVKAKP